MKGSADSYQRPVNRHLGMQTKFLLGLAVILLCFSSFSAGLIYIYEKNNLEEEAYKQTDLVMAAIDSTRGYVTKVLRPTMYSVLGDDAFVLEAMSSSYISRQVMDILKEKLPEFEYRRVALNARNPDFEATESEIKMIDFFKNNPQGHEWRGVVAREKGRYFMRFQPVLHTPSCLHCHGSPDNAPKKIIEKYGVDRGFQRTTDMVSGVVSIGIPVEVGLMKIKEVALSVFGMVFLSVFFLYGTITFFFNRLIIRNIRDLLEVFRDISKEDVNESLTKRIETSDEIGELKVTAQRMAESLQLSRNKLKDYAENLEKRVADRTAEVQELNSHLEEKVEERTREIEGLLQQEIYLRDILKLVADINELIITSSGLDELLTDSSCRFVRHNFYDFAWIGLQIGGRLEQVFCCDKEINQRAIPLEMADIDGSATARCLASGQTILLSCQEEQPAIAPCHHSTLISDLQWVIALPLRPDNFSAVEGTLTVYTWRQQGFKGEEVTMLEEVAGDLGFAISAFRHRLAVSRLEQERSKNYEETILSFVNMIDHRDTYTAGHTQRVAHYCELIATEMGYCQEDIDRLTEAATLHDIGKIATPDSILLKPGTLSEADYDLIKLHATAGFEMLSPIKRYAGLAEIIHQHHERHDGQGYPQSLQGEEIHPLARIMAVADAFDAMTTNRIYKPRKNLTAALVELEALSGSQFHPQVVTAASKVLANIKPSSSIDQLPSSELERRRFSYFFNDRLTGLYNEDYLHIILQNNQERFDYKCINILHLQGLEIYNRQAGWQAGNRLLQQLAGELRLLCPTCLFFRAFGNDFIILAKEHLELAGGKLTGLSPSVESGVTVRMRHVDLQADSDYSIHTLERLQEIEAFDE